MNGKLKRILSFLLVMLMLFTAVPVESLAAGTELVEQLITDGNILYGSTVAEGSCGTQMNWTFYEDGTLRISGQGAMSSFIFNEEILLTAAEHFNPFEDIDGEDMTEKMSQVDMNLSEELSASYSAAKKSAKSSSQSFSLKKSAMTIEETEEEEEEEKPVPLPWKDYIGQVKKIVIEEGVTDVSAFAFALCVNLTEVILPESVKTIGNTAFGYCMKLSKINLESVQIVDAYAFAGCFVLKEVSLDSVVEIRDQAFAYNLFLEKIHFGDSLKALGEGNLAYCTNLREFNLPASLKIEEFHLDSTFALEKFTNSTTDFSLLANTEIIDFGTLENARKAATMFSYYYKIAFTCEMFDRDDFTEEQMKAYIIACYNKHYGADFTQAEMAEIWSDIENNITYTPADYLDIYCVEDSLEHKFCKMYGISHTIVGESSEHFCYETSGSIGDITWSFDYDTGVLTLSGSGPMVFDHSEVDLAPWFGIRGYVREIAFAEGSSIETIGESAFMYFDKIRSVTIPATVTSIGSYAFNGSSLTSVAFEEGSRLESIERYAFSECVKLTSIALPASVTSLQHGIFADCYQLSSVIFEEGSSLATIGEYAFSYCRSLKNIDIPSTVTKIESYAFSGCESLESIGLPASLTTLGDYAFKGCESLESIELPASFTTLGSEAFDHCYSLEAINVAEGNTAYASENGILYNADKTRLIQCPTGKRGSVVVPSSVTELASYAFADCDKITDVSFPEDSALTYIGYYAFRNCDKLEVINLPASVTSMGYNVFDYSYKLKAINVAEGNTTYISENGVLYYAGRTDIYFIPYAYEGEVVVPAGVYSLSSNHFNSRKGVTSVIFEENSQLYRLDYNAFTNCTSLKTITLPSSLRYMDSYAFSGCTSLESVIFEEGIQITSIPDNAFSGCEALREIVIPSSVTSIRYRAFQSCKSLESIEIPESVARIENYAFLGCDSLETIKIYNKDCFIGDEKTTIPKNTVIYGYTDSTAQDYAEKHGRTFEALDVKELTGISIVASPSRTVFNKGYELNTDGLTITLDYSDGSQSVKTSGFEVTGYKASRVGKQTLTVTYKEFSDTFEVTVREYTPVSPEPGLSFPVYAKGSYEYTYVEFIPEVSGRYGFHFGESGNYYATCMIADENKNQLATNGSVYAYGSCYYDMTAGTKYYLAVSYGSSDAEGYITCRLSLEDNECTHENTENVPAIEPTCTADGRTEGIRCTDCKVWLRGGTFLECGHTDENTDRICDVCNESTLYSFGVAGDSITWNLYDNGDLVFVGTGDMWDYADSSSVPWKYKYYYALKSEGCVKNMIFSDGITSIGNYVINSDVETYIIPVSVTKISTYNSRSDGDLFLYCGTKEQWDAIEKDDDYSWVLLVYNYAPGVDISGTCGDNLTWLLDKNGVLTISGQGDMIDLYSDVAWRDGYKYLIKEVIISEGVTSVSSRAFYECKRLEKVTLPSTVTKISSEAFYDCRKMTEINLNSGLQTIGTYAFYNCYKLESVEIPDTVTVLDSYAFHHCTNLKYVKLPENLTYISSHLFSGCSLETIEIPSTVTSIGSEAFRSCSFKAVVIPDSVTSVGNYAFGYCRSLESVTLSANLTSIASYMFYECEKLSSIEIPEGVTTIGYEAFKYCYALAEISLPTSLTQIDNYAFSYCDSLEEITIPENVTYIGYNAFYDCDKLSSLTIPEKVTYVGSDLVSYCDNIKSVTILNPGCQLYRLGNNLPSDFVVRGYYGSTAADLCDNYGYTFVPLDMSMTHDGFEYTVDENNNVTIVGYEGEATEVVIPAEIEGMTVIAFDKFAFRNNESITSVEIPDTIGTIPNNAFSGCTNLKKVIVNGMDTVGNEKYWFGSKGMYIYGHKDSAIMDQVIYDNYEGEFISLDVEQNPDRETTIDDFVWAPGSEGEIWIIGYIGTPSVVTIPETIEGYSAIRIYTNGSNYGAFERDTRIESVYIPETVVYFNMYGHFTVVDEDNPYYSSDDDGNVYNKDKTILYRYSVKNEATEYTVPETVTGISDYAFYDADNLTSVIFPENVVNINGYNTFNNCDNLNDITVYNHQCSFASYLNLSSNPTIHAHSDTAAHSYANNYGKSFVSLCEDNKAERIDTPCGREKLKVTYCTVCSYELSSEGIGEITEHTYGEWTTPKEPTCTEDGYEIYVCTVCGEGKYKEHSDGNVYSEVLCDSRYYPETPHEYSNNMTYEYTFTHPGAQKLVLKFSSSTYTESCDYIYIYDSEDVLIGTYRGSNLGGTEVTVNGDYFRIQLTTDGSVTYYGFSFESIKALMNEYEDGYYNVLPALGHDMPEDWIVSYSATCTTSGMKTKHCSRFCGYMEAEEIPALGHDMPEEWTVSELATCTTDGLKIKQCSRISDCGHAETETIPALGHEAQEDWTVIKDATCTEDGYEVKKCSRCDADMSLNGVVCDPSTYPESSHPYSNSMNKTYTFSYPGAEQLVLKFNSSSYLENTCDFVYLYDSTGALYATYTAYLPDEEIVLNGDNFKIVLKTNRSVVFYGFKFDYIKAVAGERNDEYYNVIPALGHDLPEEFTVTREPDCTNVGSQYKYCSRCSYKETEDIPALGHEAQEEWTVVKAATCIEDGYEVKKCTRCDEDMSFNSVVCDPSTYPASPHNYYNNMNKTYTFSYHGAEKLVLKFNSSVSVENGHDYIYLYDSNDNLYGRYTGTALRNKEIILEGDSFKITLTSDYSVNNYGFGFDSIKALTGEPYDEYYNVIPALGHDLPEEFTVSGNPTCTVDGSQHKDCSRCSYKETESIPALGHDFSDEFTVDKEPTCTIDGSKSKHCSRCSEKSDVTVIDALGHDMPEKFTVTKNPTCTADGSQYKKCSRCTYRETESIPALGHDFSDEFTVDKEPTCTIDGSKSKHCSRCSEKSDVTVIDALGHNYPDEWTIVEEVSCTVDGYKYKKCTRCTEKQTETEDAYGHNYQEELVDGSDSEERHTKYTCLNCGDSYVIYFPATPVLNLVSIGQKFRVELSWLKAIEYTVTGYNVYRKTADAEEFELIATVSGRDKTSYIDYDVEVGTEYFYQVAAVKNTVIGAMGDTVSAVPQPDAEKPKISTFEYNGKVINNTISKTAVFRINANDDTAVEKCELEYAVFGTEEWTLATSKNASSGTISMDTTVLDDGHYSFRLKVYDTSGNTEIALTDHFVDNTAPEKVSGLRLVELYASQATLTWDDVTSGDRHYFIVKYKTDGKYIEVDEQIKDARGYYFKNLKPATEYTCCVAAVDFYGNVGEYSDEFTFTTTEDVTAPVVTKLTPVSSRYNGYIPFTATAEDDTSVAKVVVKGSFDGEEWFEISEKLYDGTQKTVTYSLNVDLSEYDEGLLYLRADAQDVAGNESESTSFVQYYIDKTPPSVPFNVKADSFDGYIEIKWDKNAEADISHYRVYRSTEENGTYTLIADDVNNTNTFDRNIERGTEYFYKVTSVDMCGNESDFCDVVSVVATEDDIAPTVLSISPADGKTIGANSNKIGVLAEDNAALDTLVVEYKTVAGEYKQLVSSSNITLYYKLAYAYIPVSEFSDGDKVKIRAYCTDTAGHKSEYKESTYIIDKTAPEIRDFTVNVNDNKCELSWLDCGEEDIYSFTIYERVDSGAFKVVNTITSPVLEGKYDFTRTHEATGVYSYRIVTADKAGNTKTFDSESVTVTVKEAEKPVNITPVISGPNVFEVGVEERFTAAKSTSDYNIVSYHWDYGDGTTSEAFAPIKTYSVAGEYTVTLTVTDSLGNTAQTSMKVKVEERELVGIVKVTVVDEAGNPIPNVGVYFDYSQPTQNIIGTNADGIATMKMPVGTHEIVAVGDDYLPDGSKVSVLAGETTEVEIRLSSGKIVTGDFIVKEMTLDEIKAAGIDVNDPENQIIYEVTVTFIYGDKPYKGSFTRPDNPDPTPEPIPQPINPKPIYTGECDCCDACKEGNCEGNGKGDCECDKNCDCDYCDCEKPAKGRGWDPEFYGWSSGGKDYAAAIEVPIKASYLKQFYSAKLTIMNHADSRFYLTDCNASISGGGNGLTLIGGSSMPDLIAGRSTGTAIWMYRGDSAGTYDLSASFSAELDNSGHRFNLSFPSQSVVVYDESTVKLRIEVSDLTDGNIYMNVGLVNQRPVRVNCPQIEVGDYAKNVLSNYKKIKKKENVEIPEKFEIEHKATRVTDSSGMSDIMSLGGSPQYLEPGQALVNEYIIKNVGYDGSTGVLLESIIDCAGDYEHCIEIGHIGDTPVYIGEDEYVKEHLDFVGTAEYYYMLDNFAIQKAEEAKSDFTYYLANFATLDFLSDYPDIVIADFINQESNVKQSETAAEINFCVGAKKAADDAAGYLSKTIKNNTELYKAWGEPVDIKKEVAEKLMPLYLGTDYTSDDYKLLELTYKNMDEADLKSYYKKYDVGVKSLKTAGVVVDGIGGMVKVMEFCGAYEAYDKMDDNYKLAIQGIYENADDLRYKEALHNYVDVDDSFADEVAENAGLLVKNASGYAAKKIAGVAKEKFVSYLKIGVKKCLDAAVAAGKMSAKNAASIAGSVNYGVMLVDIANKILGADDEIARILNEIVAIPGVAGPAQKSLEQAAEKLMSERTYEAAAEFDAKFNAYKSFQMTTSDLIVEYAQTKNDAGYTKLLCKDKFADDIVYWISHRSNMASIYCHNPNYKVQSTGATARTNYLIECPVEVSVYSADGTLAAHITDDSCVVNDVCVGAYTCEGKKFVSVPAASDYEVVITATDNGTMDCTVYEYNSDEVNTRQVKFDDVALVKGDVFNAETENSEEADINNYTLTKNDIETIEADYDYECEIVGISFEKDLYTINIGESIAPEVIFEPTDVSNKNLEWRVADDGVLEMSENGEFTSLKGGMTSLSVVSEDGGWVAWCQVQVLCDEHSFGEWITDTESTCTSEGSHHRDCEVCKFTETEAIGFADHTLSDYIQLKAPTCTEKGSEQAECTGCDFTMMRNIEALGHTDTDSDNICDVCDEVIDEGLNTEPSTEDTTADATEPEETTEEESTSAEETTEAESTTSEDETTLPEEETTAPEEESTEAPSSTTEPATDTTEKDEPTTVKPTVTEKPTTTKPTTTKKPTVTDKAEPVTKAPVTAATTKAPATETTENEEPVVKVKKPAKVKIKKPKSAKKKQLIVTWKKVKAANGYQVAYSLSKKFTKKVTKTKLIKKAKVTKTTVKKLKSGKKYFVRVRAYKTVEKKKLYGVWSKVMTVKVR